MNKLFKLSFISLIVISAAGCDKVGKYLEEKQQQATDALQNAQDEQLNESGANEGKAMSNYVDAENAILRIARRESLESALEKFKKRKYAEETGKVKRPDTYFDDSALNSAAEYLQKAGENKIKNSAYAQYDTLGKALAEATIPFAKTNKELHDYFESKAYLDDDFAKGRELAPKFEKEAEAFVQAYNAFSVESSKVEVIRNDELVKGLKNNKAFARAAGYEAYGHFLGFLNIVTKEDVKNEEVQAKIDAEIKGAAAAIDTFKAEMEKPENADKSRLKSALDAEIKLLGAMREAKQKNYSQSSLSSFLDDYNRFVQFTLNMGGLDGR